MNVSQFGAIPGDGMDDSKAILEAIEHAKAHNIRTVRFNAGVYEFKGPPGWDLAEEKREHPPYISLEDATGLELIGDTDEQGKATTFWIKDNDLKEGQPMMLSIRKGAGVALKNIVVDMAPYYYSAGKVMAVEGDRVTIEVLPGLMRNIYIHDNLFEDETICASLQNCADVWFWNNTLKNCKQDLPINEKTTENIHRTAPPQ